MSSSRSRVVRSSSIGQIGLFNHVQPIDSSFFERKRPAPPKPITTANPVKDSQTAQKQQQQQEKKKTERQCIFTVGSPERQNNNKKPEKGFEDLFKACNLCKKNLNLKEDVYIYSYQGIAAFCSPGCRDGRMDLDGFDNAVAKELSAKLQTSERLSGKDASRLGLGFRRYAFRPTQTYYLIVT